jgi:acetoin utilization protein AcuB
MLIREVMNKDVITISPETKLSDAYELMNKNNIRHLPVVDKDRDLRLATSRLAKKSFEPDTPVKEIMSHPVQFTHPTDPIEIATQIMREFKIGCMPVVENSKLVGIVTITDLLDALLLLTGIHRPSGRLDVRLPNKAGELARLTAIIAERKVNIHSILTYPEKDRSIRLVLRVGTIEIKSLAEALCNAGFQVIWPVHIACVS